MQLFIGFKQFENSNKSGLCLLPVIIFILFISTGTTVASEAELTNIVIKNLNHDLVIDLKIKGVFSEEMKEAVSSGILVRFTFLVFLDEVRDFWFDKKITGLKTAHQIQYDPLRKEFNVTRAWENKGAMVVKNLEEARVVISEINGLIVLPLTKLKKGTHYQLRVKSEIDDKKFRFLSFPWGFETDWYTINFIY